MEHKYYFTLHKGIVLKFNIKPMNIKGFVKDDSYNFFLHNILLIERIQYPVPFLCPIVLRVTVSAHSERINNKILVSFSPIVYFCVIVSAYRELIEHLSLLIPLYASFSTHKSHRYYNENIIACFHNYLVLCKNITAQQKPLRLWYKEPAGYWEASLLFGNGRLGAMPDGGIIRENIVLNDITLWSGGVQDADRPDAYKYLPRIRQLLFDEKNIEAQELMSKYFVCGWARLGKR